MRFNPNCKTFEEAREYFKNRALQLLKYGYRAVHIGEADYGAVGIFQHKSEEVYKTPYVLPKYRENNRFLNECRNINTGGFRVLTHKDCGLVNYLKKNKVGICYPNVDESSAYRAISHYYGNIKAKRSSLYYMNHIDEGLALLSEWFVTDIIKDAYCLHPIIQNLPEGATVAPFSHSSNTYNHNILELARGYAVAANSYLPKSGNIEELPYLDYKLRLLLKADKIQNRKDFELYNQNHPNYKDLALYFDDWFDILGISEEEYKKWKRYLIRGWL